MDGFSSTCLIEDRPNIKDFERLDIRDIQDSIQTRRTRIFVLMEEVRRLRVEQRLKVCGSVGWRGARKGRQRVNPSIHLTHFLTHSLLALTGR
jgi:hypothetical protein